MFKINSVLSILVLSLVNLAYCQTGGSCKTPTGSDGVCQFISDCPTMKDYLLRLPNQISGYRQKFLLSFRCNSPQSKSVAVCCPNDVIHHEVTKHPNHHLLPTECGELGYDVRIHNGNKTLPLQFRWMALFGYSTAKSKLSWQCGGTLINENYVLTAAHCVTNLRSGMKLEVIRLGEHNIATTEDCYINDDGEEVCAFPVQDFYNNKVIPHAGYIPKTFTNDIALVRLSRPANISGTNNVLPICLPTTAQLASVKLKFGLVTGWGQTEDGITSNALLQANLPIIPLDKCGDQYRSQNININNKQLCAKGDIADSCSGDSGGPLQSHQTVGFDVKAVQYGLVSFGPTACSRNSLSGVYTNVVSHLDWILDNLEP